MDGGQNRTKKHYLSRYSERARLGSNPSFTRLIKGPVHSVQSRIESSTIIAIYVKSVPSRTESLTAIATKIMMIQSLHFMYI